MSPITAGQRHVQHSGTPQAEATQTPLDLPVCVVLGVLSACTCGRVVVEARPGWRESVHLYLVPVLPSGERKSAVVSTATDVLYVVEETLVDRARDQIAERAALQDIARQAAEKARKAAAAARRTSVTR